MEESDWYALVCIGLMLVAALICIWWGVRREP